MQTTPQNPPTIALSLPHHFWRHTLHEAFAVRRAVLWNDTEHLSYLCSQYITHRDPPSTENRRDSRLQPAVAHFLHTVHTSGHPLDSFNLQSQFAHHHELFFSPGELVSFQSTTAPEYRYLLCVVESFMRFCLGQIKTALAEPLLDSIISSAAPEAYLPCRDALERAADEIASLFGWAPHSSAGIFNPRVSSYGLASYHLFNILRQRTSLHLDQCPYPPPALLVLNP